MNFIKSLLSRKLLWLLFIYAGLLTWSGIHRLNLPEPGIPENKNAVLLNSILGEQTLPDKIRITYKDTGPQEELSAEPVILIHGSPGSLKAFDDLTKFLKKRRVISVDLPGFGDAETDIPDYSIYAHSKYLLQLMDKLKIERAHFVGFSLGGGVILHLAEKASARVLSISMIAVIGVQEYELLGDYHINHAIHGLQLGFLWILKELTPHFGTFDGTIIPYARNFYDTDQRPLRKILEQINLPFQIIHGRDDPLVPVEAAREHARIVPQSVYYELDDNHFFVFMRPEKIEKLLQSFWTQVESGEARTGKTADLQRIKASGQPFNQKILPATGPTAFVFFLLIFLLALLNEDLAFLVTGCMVAQGRFGFAFAIIACIFGSYAGMVTMILLGRLRVEKAFQSASVEQIPENLVSKVFLRRKLFSFRFFYYFRAGKTLQRFWRYLVGFSLSSLAWAVGLISLGYYLTLGLEKTSLVSSQKNLIFAPVILAVFISTMAYRYYKPQ